MAASTKLSTSVKALCYLAEHGRREQTSTAIAAGIGVNASKLRKLLSMMGNSGIVHSSKGTQGGFILARKPEQIHLQEIYCAVEDRRAFHMDVHYVNGQHLPDTVKINNFFLDFFADIQNDIENKMKKISLKMIMDQALH